MAAATIGLGGIRGRSHRRDFTDRDIPVHACKLPYNTRSQNCKNIASKNKSHYNKSTLIPSFTPQNPIFSTSISSCTLSIFRGLLFWKTQANVARSPIIGDETKHGLILASLGSIAARSDAGSEKIPCLKVTINGFKKRESLPTARNL
jgi:hypothetical protein